MLPLYIYSRLEATWDGSCFQLRGYSRWRCHFLCQHGNCLCPVPGTGWTITSDACNTHTTNKGLTVGSIWLVHVGASKDDYVLIWFFNFRKMWVCSTGCLQTLFEVSATLDICCNQMGGSCRESPTCVHGTTFVEPSMSNRIKHYKTW